jgi:LPXTG-site transpeptidase (sortase) family protein
MNKSTIIVIIALLIIGLYAATETTYYSNKVILESNIDSPVILIPKIGLNEKINNHSIAEGVYHENASSDPTQGDVLLFGHRTMLGSPFLRLNELNKGDIVTLEWPGIGEVNYTITNQTIVPANTDIKISNDTQRIILVTCHPIGSTSERLICEGNLTSKGPLDNQTTNDNPHKDYGIYITLGFLIFGLIVSYAFKEDRKYILATVILITLFLVYCILQPGPVSVFTSQIEFLNQIFTLGV